MSTTEPWTVGRLLTWTTEYLQKCGSSSPRLDAEVLLADARSCQRIELYTAFGEEPPEAVKTAFREMVKRRAEGTPVAYLVGHKEFYSLQFDVNPDVLIPRPETEHLVVAALDIAAKLFRECKRPLKIADVGTGSGAIAVSVAKHFSDCHVTAFDISSAALSVARQNATKHELDETRIRFVESDLMSACPEEKFDLILSNPPYVSVAEFESLEKTVREYEPALALVGGPDGFEIIQRLLSQAAKQLEPGGSVVIEFSPMLARRVDEFIDSQWKHAITKDLAGNARIITLTRA